MSSIPDDTTASIVFDTRYLRCRCRSYKLRLPYSQYVFGSLGIENSIVEIGIGIQV